MIKKTNCSSVLIDQFANPSVVISQLKKKGLDLPIEQKHKAESDLIVAAASIIARAAFVEALDSLSSSISQKLPKGGGRETLIVGKELLQSQGKEVFPFIAKLHFKNYQEITDF
jgi:ribonuclease HIII